MTKKNEYQIEREREEAIIKKTMKGLTSDQLKAIDETHKSLANALSMLTETNDLYLSDIRKLDNAFWKLKHQFNLKGEY
jgi:hypothetical protein|tara:strand:- start:199 stop:435 length:237 start_codon:yes stop_codon:yes gene_type:complete